MKQLTNLLADIEILVAKGDASTPVNKICFDSRRVKGKDVFVAIRGTQTDGHQHIDEAITSGASSVVCEQMPANIRPDICYVLVRDSAAALSLMAANYHGYPARDIRLIGVTGTNGKTTIATLLYQLFSKLGYRCGLISTVEIRINGERLPASHTTPDALSLQEKLSAMRSGGCSHCFMEVSSHAIAQSRVYGLNFNGAVYTNVTRDHLDYHGSFTDYVNTKKKLFDCLDESAFALINADDSHADLMIRDCRAQIRRYGLGRHADFSGKVLEKGFGGMEMRLDGQHVWTSLIGAFNASNLMAVYACAVLIGEENRQLLTVLSELQSVRGRFQHIRSADGTTAIVDYAHTPDALKNVLKTILDIQKKGEKVITVVGCGGNRDRGKRSQMAAIACAMSDKVILTSDNPRNEDPAAIISDMEQGIPEDMQRKVISIVDRMEAIKTAWHLAVAKDIILVAGKGHEDYQEVNGIRKPFSDLQILEELMRPAKDENQPL